MKDVFEHQWFGGIDVDYHNKDLIHSLKQHKARECLLYKEVFSGIGDENEDSMFAQCELKKRIWTAYVSVLEYQIVKSTWYPYREEATLQKKIYRFFAPTNEELYELIIEHFNTKVIPHNEAIQGRIASNIVSASNWTCY